MSTQASHGVCERERRSSAAPCTHYIQWFRWLKMTMCAIMSANRWECLPPLGQREKKENQYTKCVRLLVLTVKNLQNPEVSSSVVFTESSLSPSSQPHSQTRAQCSTTAACQQSYKLFNLRWVFFCTGITEDRSILWFVLVTQNTSWFPGGNWAVVCALI